MLRDLYATTVRALLSLVIFGSTAKTYNGKWIPWAVGKKTAAKRSKRQKTEPAIWTSEIPVRDVVMAVEVTNEQGFVKIMSASIKRISEYTDHYETVMIQMTTVMGSCRLVDRSCAVM